MDPAPDAEVRRITKTDERSAGTAPADTAEPNVPGQAPGRLDVSVDDETYEAGSGNIIVITVRNPFAVPVEILELKEPRSSSLRKPVKGDSRAK
jgi:hypothetical protein